MNPGVFCLLTMIILSILFLSGWGTRYTNNRGVTTARAAWILVAIGILCFWSFPVRHFLVNCGALLLVAVAIVFWANLRPKGAKLQFLCAIVTAGSCCFTLMTLVPHDPAFYPLSGRYLYPMVAVLVMLLFSRAPRFCLIGSSMGMLLAGTAQESRMLIGFHLYQLGSPELLDYVATAALFAFIFEQFAAFSLFLTGKLASTPQAEPEGDA